MNNKSQEKSNKKPAKSTKKEIVESNNKEELNAVEKDIVENQELNNVFAESLKETVGKIFEDRAERLEDALKKELTIGNEQLNGYLSVNLDPENPSTKNFIRSKENIERIDNIVSKDNNSKFLDSKTDGNYPIDSSFVQKLIIDSTEDLPIIDRKVDGIGIKQGGGKVIVNHAIALQEESKKWVHRERVIERKERREKPISRVVDGVIKVNRPFKADMAQEKHNAKIAKKHIDINSTEAEHIRKSYGSLNYESSISLHSGYDFKRDPIELNSIPDVNAKLLDMDNEESGNAITTGKTFYEQNKDQMKQQMNVVAFYSIKDAKPFYYVSSAEARLAIEYISQCRKYKKDIFKINIENITTLVDNTDEIVKMAKLKKDSSCYKRMVWEDVFGTVSCEELDSETRIINESVSKNIKNVWKQSFMPFKNDKFLTTFQSFEILVKNRWGSWIHDAVKLHESLSLLSGYSHYVVCNSKTINGINKELIKPNITEREIYHMVGKYDNKSFFINENIREQSFIIISRRFDDNEVFVSEYELKEAQETEAETEK